MNIVHIAPNSPYNEGWGYQENLLPKFHAKCGHNVTLVVSNEMHHDGKLVETECENYVSECGYRVIRRKPVLCKIPGLKNLFSKIEVYSILLELKPDYVFYHGLVSSTIFQVTRYKRNVNSDMVIVQDNHLDYNIGFGRKPSFKERLIILKHRIVYRLNDKYVSKVYGVTPWRRDYAVNVFGVPCEKADVLIMGADDEKVDFANKELIREKIRNKFAVEKDSFLVVTGGKIDKRKNILSLMHAVSGMKKIKLLIFGNVLPDVADEFNDLLDANKNIIYVGWIASSKVYDYFFAADLIVFPGQHSVLWEQACASKIPCVFEKWDGMDHVNNGGNSEFIFPVTVDTLRDKIKELFFSKKYYEMKTVAESEKTDVFLYSNIAKKTLELF